MSQTPTGSHQRIDFLDSLRFIAAGAVLFQHGFEGRNETYDAIVDFTSPGVFGVVLFFFISGFVMPITAERGFELKSFIARRIFRIYPLLLCAFAVVVLLAMVSQGAMFTEAYSTSAKLWLANLLLVQDYVGEPGILGVTWTLSLEFAWYALFAIMTLRKGKPDIAAMIKWAPPILIALTLVSLAIQVRMPFGRIGMIYAAILGARGYQLLRGQIDRRTFFKDVAIFEVVTLISNGVAFGYFQHPNITMWQAIMPWTIALAIFAGACGFRSVNQSRAINLPAFRYLGQISYSIYLLHPIALTIEHHWLNTPLAPFLGIALTILMSAAAYEFIEKPGQKLAKPFLNAKPKPAAQTAGE